VTLPPLVFPGSTVLVVRDDEKTLHNFDDRSLVGILNSLTSASASNDEKSKLFALSSQTGSLEYPGVNQRFFSSSPQTRRQKSGNAY
jgi:hypothetical protein